MILNEFAVNTLLSSIEVCNLFEIDTVIIEPDLVRGLGADNQIVLISNMNTDIDGYSITLNRLDTLAKRIKLLDSNTSIECEVNGTMCNKLQITSKKLKVDFRCANITMFDGKIPKELGVKKLYEIPITDKLFDTLNKGKSAMKANTIGILADEGNITYKLNDDSNDLKEQMLYEDIVLDDNITFTGNYDAKLLLKAISKCDKFVVAEHSVLIFDINGFNVYLLAKK